MTIDSPTPSMTVPQLPGARTPPAEPTMVPYMFPRNKLKVSHDSGEQGSSCSCGLWELFAHHYSARLKMFEMSKCMQHGTDTDFEIVGNYLSPVSDSYAKKDLAPTQQRLAMCTLAVEDTDILGKWRQCPIPGLDPYSSRVL
ncbi:hypothetical protein QBC33DRAFT_513171 [Phialemonium atrogriseum]|uniref:Uncharacterized protein n=1 Tax=Phialemonium atrogriseum TaxID=1093897 RepID=A0AAJ0C6M5_9PEZI|nr:uncharacterized protein QBC33DRAFT_513171 [Phialemonium atrogriseum]KAK1769687.1 hypothetical protein QBC33DRAFT_513171 [Phialemonium atrogriseum]